MFLGARGCCRRTIKGQLTGNCRPDKRYLYAHNICGEWGSTTTAVFEQGVENIDARIVVPPENRSAVLCLSREITLPPAATTSPSGSACDPSAFIHSFVYSTALVKFKTCRLTDDINLQRSTVTIIVTRRVSKLKIVNSMFVCGQHSHTFLLTCATGLSIV